MLIFMSIQKLVLDWFSLKMMILIKVLALVLKTIPYNDNGIFHILEHSVLCGSAKYPVKEPFVELLKGSFNTFLNAMTFS